MKHTFRALAERDFRLYFFGQALSPVGMSSFGMLPISALVAATIARAAGVHLVFVVAGLGAIAAGLAFRRQLPRLRELARPVLLEKGLVSP